MLGILLFYIAPSWWIVSLMKAYEELWLLRATVKRPTYADDCTSPSIFVRYANPIISPKSVVVKTQISWSIAYDQMWNCIGDQDPSVYTYTLSFVYINIPCIHGMGLDIQIPPEVRLVCFFGGPVISNLRKSISCMSRDQFLQNIPVVCGNCQMGILQEMNSMNSMEWNLVPLIDGNIYIYIITQLAIYQWYISGVYCQLGDYNYIYRYISPTTY